MDASKQLERAPGTDSGLSGDDLAGRRNASTRASQSDAKSMDVAQACLAPTIPFEAIKAAMDKSMAGVNGVYFTHRQIRQPGGSPGLSFVYFQGSAQGSVPSLQDIKSSIRAATAKKQAAEHLLAQARQENNQEKMTQAAEQLQAAAREAVRGEEFMCVETGTSSNMPPVRMYQKGLPDWMLNEEVAEAAARQYLGGAAQLAETTRTVLGSQCIYTFTGPAGQQVHVDPTRKQVFTDWQVAGDSSQDALPDEAKNRARNERVRQQWEEFLSDGIDMSRFSLANRTDLSGRDR